MLKIQYHSQFKRDYKLAVKRGLNINNLLTVIKMLANEQTLPEKYRDHALIDTNKYKKVRECHIQSDWLLIYKIDDNILTLELIRTGTHSDLFQ